MTLLSGELRPLTRTNEKPDSGAISTELAKRLVRWRTDPSLLTAAELVETAIVDGRDSEAVRAATRLVQIDGRATPLIKEQAARLLARAGAKMPWSTNTLLSPAAISIWRKRTRDHPQDALAWMELALHQTIIGKIDSARRSVAIAMQFAPNNRHVLRSAARFYLHAEDRERAHDILVRSPATRSDPWLLAAEISTAGIVGRSPKYTKAAAHILADGGLFPRQITEMAAAIGTLELVDGNRKKARKAFDQSLVDPNGNAAAQAEWASPQFGGLLIPLNRLEAVAEPAEALAFHRFGERRYGEVPKYCETWATEEPYSIRPYEFGSAAAGAAGDYLTAIDLAIRGLKQRPGSPRLSNSLAFALASVDRSVEALNALEQMKTENIDETTNLVAVANRGLIAYRSGRPGEGAARYRDAVDGFRKLGERRNEANARVYHARESHLANEPGSEQLLATARDHWAKLERNPHPVLERLERTAPAVESSEKKGLLRVSASHQMRFLS